MRQTEELEDGTRVVRRGALWYLLGDGDPVGRGYHDIEPAPVPDFYVATRGARKFVVDARGVRVSAGYHEIEHLGDGEFRGTDGASEETFSLPADARADEESESGGGADAAASDGDASASDG